MGAWIELNCDIRADVRDIYGRPACFSNAASAPGVLAHHAKTDVIGALTFLLANAKRAGWTVTKSRMACPTCGKKAKD